MAHKNKTIDTTKIKINIVGFFGRVKKLAPPVIDRMTKLSAAVFFIATSYGYVEAWLKAHQQHSDLSVATAIMVVSIALYLYCRQR